jgi:hypothetical protein
MVAKDQPATTSPAGTGDAKLEALSRTIAAVATLSRSDQLDVLRAAANFCGLVIVMELPR